MMRLGRRALLLVVFLLLTSAAFRSFAVLPWESRWPSACQ